MLDVVNDDVLAFERSFSHSSVSVAINFASQPRRITLGREMHQILSSHTNRTGTISELTLEANEAIILEPLPS
jgi:hypothetical protein